MLTPELKSIKTFSADAGFAGVGRDRRDRSRNRRKPSCSAKRSGLPAMSGGGGNRRGETSPRAYDPERRGYQPTAAPGTPEARARSVTAPQGMRIATGVARVREGDMLLGSAERLRTSLPLIGHQLIVGLRAGSVPTTGHRGHVLGQVFAADTSIQGWRAAPHSAGREDVVPTALRVAISASVTRPVTIVGSVKRTRAPGMVMRRHSRRMSARLGR